jgi:hypothetical protein
MVKLANIPEEAAAGLAGVISDSKMNPKQLQHEADKVCVE